MTLARGCVAIAMLAAFGCSSTDRAKDEAKDANEKVVEERKDVGKAEQKLVEQEGELREAQAEADAKAVKLDNRLQKDTAARRP